MVNKVVLVGNVGRDPELKSTNGGAAVCNFTMATTERWKKDGEKQERVTWHNITAFAKSAELAGQYIKKGMLIFLEGVIRQDQWEDAETGVKKYKTYIVAERFQMLSSPERAVAAAEPAFDSDESQVPNPKGAARSDGKRVHNYAPGANNEPPVSGPDELPF